MEGIGLMTANWAQVHMVFLLSILFFTDVSITGSSTMAQHAAMEGIELMMANSTQTTHMSFGLRYVFIVIIYSSMTPQHATTEVHDSQ